MDIDYKKTKLFIQSMKLGAAGWKEGKQGDLLEGPVVYLYVIDRPGSEAWTWMCSCALDGFATVSGSASVAKSEWQSFRNSFSAVLAAASDGKAPPVEQGHDWETQLALLGSAYAGTTKVWEVAEKLKLGGHFIILNYRAKGSDVGMLRPFALPHTDGKLLSMLTVNELMSMVSEVVANDRKKHPEWFLER